MEPVVRYDVDPEEIEELSLFVPLTNNRLLINHPGVPDELTFPGGFSKSSLNTTVWAFI